MNTGIQDAWNLGWKLAVVTSHGADPALLDSYQNERAPVGRSVVRFTDRAFRLATSQSPAARFLRAQVMSRLAPVALRSPVRARGVRRITELDISYRRSPAVTDGGPRVRRGPRAGDRLPDATIERAGRPGRLHDLTAAPRFHLLLCGRSDAWSPTQLQELDSRYAGRMDIVRVDTTGGADVLDVNGEVFARLHVRGPTTVLTRPDGHIGYYGTTASLHGVAAYLRRWLPRR
jgi:hypothetical protein